MSLLTELQCAPVPDDDVLLDVRVGQIQALGKSFKSGIFKESCKTPIQVTTIGLVGDQQEAFVHGGVEKALHHYASTHYPVWSQEKPDLAHMFQIGAFGENLVTARLDEENVCLGDIFRIGRDVRVIVGEPRQPCYKLNHRFGWIHAQKRTLQTNRVGWYYRVLTEGTIQRGHKMVLEHRPYPQWSIANIQRVLFNKLVDRRLILDLDQIEELGSDTKGLAQRRLKGAPFGEEWKTYKVADARMVTARVRELTLVANMPFSGLNGISKLDVHAHAQIRFGPKSKKLTRSYSIVSGDQNQFRLGIALDDNSRGGSEYIHHQLQIDEEIDVYIAPPPAEHSTPVVSSSEVVDHFIFIIGGIGVTAFLPTLAELERAGRRSDCSVHYACRSASDAAYLNDLPPNTVLYVKNEGRLDLAKVLRPAATPAQCTRNMIFCCGPTRLMNECRELAERFHYPSHMVHFESFGPGKIVGDAFDVNVRHSEIKRHESLHVPADRSLLHVLRETGFDVASNCEIGKCGMCVVSLYGKNDIDHIGTALDDDFRNTSMLACVDRGRGRISIQIE